MAGNLDPRLLAAIRAVKAKRPRTVIDHILKHGHVSTEDLKETYGYNHPPRAARDVREQGIPLETFRITGGDGRKIAAYRFGDPSKIEAHKLGGRTTLSKALGDVLFEKQRGRCALTGVKMERRYLQIDHRIPYEVAGDKNAVADETDPGAFMMVSGTANRQKSWSCENCDNWKTAKDLAVCQSCYWAKPEDYQHVATVEIRQATVSWQGEEVADYSRIEEAAAKSGCTVSEYIRWRLSGNSD